jgi:hypothetical protein
VAVAGPATMEPKFLTPLHQHEDHATGQSVGAPNIKSLPIHNNMLRTLTAVEQFMREFNGTVSEEEIIVEITKIISNLMKQNDY